jgi:hypothetical protein
MVRLNIGVGVRLPASEAKESARSFAQIPVWLGTGLNARGRAEHLARLDFTNHLQLPQPYLMFFSYIHVYIYTFNLFQMQFGFKLLKS